FRVTHLIRFFGIWGVLPEKPSPSQFRTTQLLNLVFQIFNMQGLPVDELKQGINERASLLFWNGRKFRLD
ncbi:MAG: hypothetical protein D3924_16195, partial [Candidatus Electrothrix sp. AR4]|nr:hypothetical protein [Candidatus Electrothrix sp. AR4]